MSDSLIPINEVYSSLQVSLRISQLTKKDFSISSTIGHVAKNPSGWCSTNSQVLTNPASGFDEQKYTALPIGFIWKMLIEKECLGYLGLSLNFLFQNFKSHGLNPWFYDQMSPGTWDAQVNSGWKAIAVERPATLPMGRSRAPQQRLPSEVCFLLKQEKNSSLSQVYIVYCLSFKYVVQSGFAFFFLFWFRNLKMLVWHNGSVQILGLGEDWYNMGRVTALSSVKSEGSFNPSQASFSICLYTVFFFFFFFQGYDGASQSWISYDIFKVQNS